MTAALADHPAEAGCWQRIGLDIRWRSLLHQGKSRRLPNTATTQNPHRCVTYVDGLGWSLIYLRHHSRSLVAAGLQPASSHPVRKRRVWAETPAVRFLPSTAFQRGACARPPSSFSSLSFRLLPFSKGEVGWGFFGVSRRPAPRASRDPLPRAIIYVTHLIGFFGSRTSSACALFP